MKHYETRPAIGKLSKNSISGRRRKGQWPRISLDMFRLWRMFQTLGCTLLISVFRKEVDEWRKCPSGAERWCASAATLATQQAWWRWTGRWFAVITFFYSKRHSMSCLLFFRFTMEPKLCKNNTVLTQEKKKDIQSFAIRQHFNCIYMPQELPHLRDFPKKSISISHLYNQIHKLYPAWDWQRRARVTEAHFGKFKGVGGNEGSFPPINGIPWEATKAAD